MFICLILYQIIQFFKTIQFNNLEFPVIFLDKISFFDMIEIIKEKGT